MPQPHTLLKLTSGRDAANSPEAMMQLLATLPRLQNRWWQRLRGGSEAISLEIATVAQNTAFYINVPRRVEPFIISTLKAAYPEALSSPPVQDPLAVLSASPEQPAIRTLTANIGKRGDPQLPLQTFRDFDGHDSLAVMLSALSKAEPDEVIVWQCLVEREATTWGAQIWPGFKRQVLGTTEVANGTDNSPRTNSSHLLGVRMRLAVATHSHERRHFWRETMTAALQHYSQNEGCTLRLRRPYWGGQRLLAAICIRAAAFTPKQALSLEEMATLYHLPGKELAHVRGLAWGKELAGEPPANLPIVQPGQRDVSVIGRVQFKNQDVLYGLQRPDRRRHVYIIGKTGTGKSTLLAHMAIHDIAHGEGLCVIDPHGDLVELLLDYIPSQRINDVIYIDPSHPGRVVKINPFASKQVTHRELVASGILSVFHKLYGHSWGPRLEYILRNALLSLLPLPSPRLSDVIAMLTNAAFRGRVLQQLDDEILRNFWLQEFETMPDRLRAEAIAPILNKVGQFVTSPLVRDVVDVQHGSLDLAQAMNGGKIVLANLSQGKLGEDNAALLGAILTTQIQLAAMARVHVPESERRDFYLYVDEFQNFATESFTKILAEARKYRLNLVLANQYVAQMPESVQKAIFGNCGTLISMTVGAEDAAILSREFNNTCSPADLTTLARYQLVNRLSIDNTVHPPFPARANSLLFATLSDKAKILRVSRERYSRPRSRDGLASSRPVKLTQKQRHVFHVGK